MAAKKKAVSMAAFNVADLSNEGVKMPLFLPDGTETTQYLLVGGGDSKAFKAAQARANRDLLRLAQAKQVNKKKRQEANEGEDVAQDAREREAIIQRQVAALVVGWSFPEECTPENVLNFLQSAPQIQQQVDEFAGDRANFFAKPSPA